MKNSPEENFFFFFFVFFKMKGFPWWPGIISNIEILPKKKVYLIVDPYTNTISRINDEKKIIKFEENIENVAEKAKGRKYKNSIIMCIEQYFEGKKMPKKYEKIINDLKEENNDKNKENINNEENRGYINNKKTKEEKGEKKENKKITSNSKNYYILNKKRKSSSNKDELNQKKDNKIKKIENKPIFPEKEKESPKGDKKGKEVELVGLSKIKEEIREKEKREERLKKLQEKYELNKIKERKELNNQIEKEEIESQSSSTSEKKENNLMIKNYKNFDFYQIVKYLKRIAKYLDKNQKEGKSSYFTIEDKKNFINLMEYLNNKEMDDTIQFLRITNIGNYINYINEKTKIKEFKELTQKFLENNSQKIQLQLFVENALNIKEMDI